MSLPLVFPQAEAARLEPHLPPLSLSIHANNDDDDDDGDNNDTRPFVTLTFATSLDSALSLGPGIRTALSGPQSKAMTHYLRSRHDAICVGVGTAIADDPGLNCRIAPVPAPAVADIPNGKAAVAPTPTPFPGSVVTGQPRPVVIDPQLRWDLTSQSKVMQLARAGQGLAPYIITSVSEPPAARRSLLEEHGGKFLLVQQTPDARDGRQRFDWRTILAAVRAEGLRSIMIEGGGEVINSLLSPENNELIDSVIVTIAPTWLGRGGVVVSPPRQLGEGDGGGGDGKGEGKGARPPPGPAARLANPTWLPLGEDVVLCGRIAK